MGDGSRTYVGLVAQSGELGDETSPSYLERITIDEAEMRVRYGLSVSTALTDCATDEWNCISDGVIEFAISRTWTFDEDRWAYRGVEYSILEGSQEDGTIFVMRRGATLESANLRPMVYLYSQRDGLIGFVMEMAGDDDEPVLVTYVAL
jgi:hypothetical protein